MASSAWGFNTAGLASETSPGLVGTSTQTFGGDKTLTGLVTASGGIINTGLTGANATTVTTSGSSKVGEYRFSNQASAITLSIANTNLASLTLPTGIWSISGTAVASPTATSTQACYAWISNISANYDSTSFISSGNLNTSGNTHYTSTLNRIVNVTAATQQFWLGAAIAGTAPTGSWTTASIIQAVRIA